MIVVPCKQGGEEWLAARMGIVTTSALENVLTPKTLKASGSQRAYMMRLLAEWLTGVPSDPEARGYMERGKILEAGAVRQYRFEKGLAESEVEAVGLVMRDDRMVASSPDRLIGKTGLLEVKCPSAPVHVANLLGGMGGYTCQVQGQLWVCEREWCDLISHLPDMPLAVTHVRRDEEVIAALEREVGLFVEKLLEARATLIARGCEPSGRLKIPVSMVSEDPF